MALGRAAQPVPGAVSHAAADTRAAFIRRTYIHLAVAILAFVGLEYWFIQSELAARFTYWAWGPESSYQWLLVIGLFMATGWVADKWARSTASPGVQYLGLALTVVSYTVLLAPLLFVATYLSDQPNLIETAGIMTLLLAAGLTATVFITGKDFSFMRGALVLATFAALGIIVAGMIVGFDLGLVFSGAMIALFSGWLLYYTSNVLHHYRPDQHVAASLALFGAIATLFYYVLFFLMELRD